MHRRLLDGALCLCSSALLSWLLAHGSIEARQLVRAPLTNEAKGYIILDVLNAYKCVLHLYAFMYKERKAGQRRTRRIVMGCKEQQES